MEQNKEGIPCKVVIEESAGMLSERVLDCDDDLLARMIDHDDEDLEVRALQSVGDDERTVSFIDSFDWMERG